MSMKQGIVTILGSDCEKNRAVSIRRTLSADMSSMKWLEQNGFFPPLKKTASSSEEMVRDHDSSSSFSSEECEKINNKQNDVWRMIQSQKEVQKLDVQKSENSVCNLLPPPPPYVHPLLKRSASAMSEKSLEICTESLGSETGSDGWFPMLSLNSKVLSDGEKEERKWVGKECTDPFEDFHVAKYKRCPARTIPPPLSSISGGDGAVSIHIHSHRKKGRLVLEAVSVSPRKYFHAQRRDGRLVLSLKLENEAIVEEFEKVFGNMEEADEEEGADAEESLKEQYSEESLKEQYSKSLPNQINKSAVIMKKLMRLGNKNPTQQKKSPNWSHKFNKVVKDLPDAQETMCIKDVSEQLQISHSLPPRPRMTRLISSADTCFNAYDDKFWRSKAQTAHFKNSKSDAAKTFDQYQEIAPHIKGHKIKYFVPYFRGCNKEPTTQLIRDAYCIATS